MTKQRLLLILMASLVFILLFSWVAGFWTPKVKHKQAAGFLPPSIQDGTSEGTYATELVKQVESDQPLTFGGQIQARQQAFVAARMTADIAEILVESGDQVAPGDVLIRLEKETLSARVRQQQQALASAQAQVNEARNQHHRTHSLVSQKLLPESAYDASLAQLEVFEAQLNQMKEALSEAQTSEGYSVILAPFKGIVQDRNVSVGDIATPGMPLVQLYQPESLRFEAWVSESVLAYVQLEQAVAVQLDAHRKIHQGYISEVVPALDTVSRSFKIRITLEDNEGLKPGMFGRVQIPTKPSKQVLVPTQSVLEVGQLEMLYVLNQNQVERRLVRLGTEVKLPSQHENELMSWRVVLSGIKAGEQVLLHPKELKLRQ